MDSIENMPKENNLSKTERRALQDLKKRDVVCLPSDKGGEFCVLDTERYDAIAFEHLSDDKIYKRVPRMTAKTVETKINGVWKDVSKEAEIPCSTMKSYISNQQYRFA